VLEFLRPLQITVDRQEEAVHNSDIATRSE
jgi:hypothetical protein